MSYVNLGLNCPWIQNMGYFDTGANVCHVCIAALVYILIHWCQYCSLMYIWILYWYMCYCIDACTAVLVYTALVYAYIAELMYKCTEACTTAVLPTTYITVMVYVLMHCCMYCFTVHILLQLSRISRTYFFSLLTYQLTKNTSHTIVLEDYLSGSLGEEETSLVSKGPFITTPSEPAKGNNLLLIKTK